MTRLRRARCAAAALVLLAAVITVTGCERRDAAGSGVRITWSLAPQPPVAGPAELTITPAAADGNPLEGAVVRLEGHMSHAGMAPVIAEGTERRPGEYLIPFTFTMAGDWVLLVSIVERDGTRTQQRIDVAAVRAAS